jgi:hypothetical protein
MWPFLLAIETYSTEVYTDSMGQWLEEFSVLEKGIDQGWRTRRIRCRIRINAHCCQKWATSVSAG